MDPEATQIVQTAINQLTTAVAGHQANVTAAQGIVDAAEAAATQAAQAATDAQAAQQQVIDLESRAAASDQAVVDALTALLAQQAVPVTPVPEPTPGEPVAEAQP